jgi:hypothetical protein
MPWSSGATPQSSDVMAGHVRLGDTVRAFMLDGPERARRRR